MQSLMWPLPAHLRRGIYPDFGEIKNASYREIALKIWYFYTYYQPHGQNKNPFHNR